MSDHPLVAEPLGFLESVRRWAVPPKHCHGTHGWYPYAWSVIRVEAWDAEEAVRVATPIAAKQRMGVKP